MATSKAKKPYHLFRITNELLHDLMTWKMFIDNFNGTSFILDENWLTNFDIQLFSDSAGKGIGKCCGCYFMGKWAFLPFLKLYQLLWQYFYGTISLKRRELFSISTI